MIPVTEREDANVIISVPGGSLARYVQFEMSMEGLFVPVKHDLYRITSGSPAVGRNNAVREAWDLEPKVTHWFFTDDDHAFEGDTLMRLLNRKQPVVCALTNWRVPPFIPMVFKGENVDEFGKRKLLSYSLAELDGISGCHPVYAAAGAGLLVERSVFEALPDPWFRVGTMNPEELSEDLYFYESCRDAGIVAYVDFDVNIAHMAVVAVRLVKDGSGRWQYELTWENKKVTWLTR